MSTLEGTTMHPRYSHIGACWDLLEWFQLFGTSQNTFFFKKNQISWFRWCSTREDLSIDVSITNVGLILTKPGGFLFSGYGQTDTVFESSNENMSARKKFPLKAQN